LLDSLLKEMKQHGWVFVAFLLFPTVIARNTLTSNRNSDWEESISHLGLDSAVHKDVNVFESGMRRVGNSFAELVKAAMLQSRKKDRDGQAQRKGVETAMKNGASGKSQESDARVKRFINLPAAWKVIYHEFPRTVHNVMENAEIRYDAERKNIVPIDYSSMNNPSGKMYKIETSDQPDPLVPTSFGDFPASLSQPLSPFQTTFDIHMPQPGQPLSSYQTNFDNSKPQPGYSGLTKRETATTFNPADLRKILGRDSLNRFTHYSKVKNHKKNHEEKHEEKVPEAEEVVYVPAAEVAEIEVATPVKPPFNTKFRIFKRSAAGLDEEEESYLSDTVRNIDVADQILHSSVDTDHAVQKMKSAEKSLDHALQQVLGGQDVKMFKKLVEEAQNQIEPESLLHSKLHKRSVEEEGIDKLEMAVANFKAVMDVAMLDLDSPDAALQKILEAEEDLDTALHNVMGNQHEDDEKDVTMLQKILNEEKLPKSHFEKRATKSEVEDAIKRSVNNMAAVNKILEQDTDMEKALQTIIAADHDITQIIDKILGKNEADKMTHSRRKRAHGVGYYDPQYQWLLKELDLPIDDQINLHKLENIMEHKKHASLQDSDNLETVIQKVQPSLYDSLQSSPQAHQTYHDIQYVKPAHIYSQPSSTNSKHSDIYDHSSSTYSQPTVTNGQSPESYNQVYRQHGNQQTVYYTPTYEQPSADYSQQLHYGHQSNNPAEHKYFDSQPYLVNQQISQALDKRGALERLVDQLTPLRNSIPTEVEAAYHGVVEVGKHVGKRIQPYVDSGYRNVAHLYIPQAKKTFNNAVDSVPEDIKDFARQGRKIVESRANYASQIAKPRMKSLQQSLWLLQEQLKQVAQETSEYTTNEVVPALLPTIQGLLFDVQETLELASNIVEEDVKPFVGELQEDVFKPTYEEITTKVVYPAARTVSDYVFNPVASSVVDYVVDPVSERARPAYNKYAVPVYQSARQLAGSAVSGVSSAAESSREIYQESVRPRLQTFADNSRNIYKDSVRPRLENFSVSTSQVLDEQVRPAVSEAAAAVGNRAARIGGSIKDGVVPPLQEGLRSTLNTVFTGIPSLVQQLSFEAHDAAKVFSGKYSQTLENLKVQEHRKKLAEEIQLSMLRADEEEKENRVREENRKREKEQYKAEEINKKMIKKTKFKIEKIMKRTDDETHFQGEAESDEEASIEDVMDTPESLEGLDVSENLHTRINSTMDSSTEKTSTQANGDSPVTMEPEEEYKTSTEL
jgi:hypothetical protein